MSYNLEENGVEVFQVIPKEKVKELRENIIDDIRQFPEYKYENSTRVLGAFGAMGNPSSFHCISVREIRDIVYQYSILKLKSYYQGRYCSMIFDRLSKRLNGSTISAESWHRDLAPKKDEHDIILGGWINLDDEDQYFSCIPNTHRDNTNDVGFIREQCREGNTKIKIPPGCWIAFYSDILHEIAKKKYTKDSYKLYIGFYISNQQQPLYKIDNIINTQSVPPLPSGEYPPIYTKNHIMFRKQKIEELKDTMENDILENGTLPRIMKSLQHYRDVSYGYISMYPEYSLREKNIFYPIQL